MKQLFTARILGLLATSLMMTVPVFADTFNGHEYVDLGLPSGVRWATCNLGASSPQDYGDYYAWGELETKSAFDVDTYNPHHTVYSGDSEYHLTSQHDASMMLLPGCDAAWTNWGGSWRMPSGEDFDELCKKCTWTWQPQGNTSYGGVAGYKVTGPNGNSIFLPSAGEIVGSTANHTGNYGNYWTSTVCSTDNGESCQYCFFGNTTGKGEVYTAGSLVYGQSIRPVYTPVWEIGIYLSGHTEFSDNIAYRINMGERHQGSITYSLKDKATNRFLKHEAYHENPHYYGDHNAHDGPYDTSTGIYTPTHFTIISPFDVNGTYDVVNVFVLAPGEDFGSCGDNLRFKIDTEYDTNSSYRLDITGSGDMTSFESDYKEICYYTESGIWDGQNMDWEHHYKLVSESYGGGIINSVSIDDGVTSLCDRALSICTKIETIEIPSSIKKIGAYLFGAHEEINYGYSYANLKSIFVGSVPPQIEETTFDAVDKSTCKLIIPAGSKTAYQNAPYWNEFQNIVEAYTLKYTSNDGRIVTPCISGAFGANIINNVNNNGVGTIFFDGEITSIGNGVFSSCTSLTSIEIPSSVTNIGISAFRDCTSLTSIEIPSSVTNIGFSAFRNCFNLTSIEIPSSVTSIGDYAFYDCPMLTSIDIQPGVTSIGSYAFAVDYVYGYSLLTSITIPASVTSIGDHAFEESTSLISIEIPSSVTSISSYMFCACHSLNSVTIPSSVTTIGDGAFVGCSSLTSIGIPSSVTSIGDNAFSNCI